VTAVSASDCAGVLTAPDGGNGLLVRVGEQFGWAGGGTVAIGPVGRAQWNSLSAGLSEQQVQADGVRWSIDQSEGDVNP
jgi:hypothetical protein